MEAPLESIKTGIANAQNSFVDASKGKTLLSSASSVQDYGEVSGLEVAANSDSSVKVSPGSALNRYGDVIQVESERNSFFNGKQLTAGDFRQEQDYKRHKNEWSAQKGGLSAVNATIDSFRSQAVIQKLSEITGISSEELQSLFSKYALDAGKLPAPPDAKVYSFVQDPAFASCSQQDLLAALYAQ